MEERYGDSVFGGVEALKLEEQRGDYGNGWQEPSGMEQQYGYGFRDRLMRTNTDLHRCIPYDVRLKASI